MRILTVGVNDLIRTNCYIVYDENNPKALIIDPGGDFLKISQELSRIGKCAGAVIITHCHFDHIGAVSDFSNQNVPVFMSAADESFIGSDKNLGSFFGVAVKPFVADNRLIEGDMTISGFVIKVFFTPGHTPGSVCLLIGDGLFTGDTLMNNGFGRTDFPGGSMSALTKSIKRLFEFDVNYTVYPGHGAQTTLFYEREHNDINWYTL